MILNVPIFSQADPRWAGVQLGFSSTTIQQYGCLLTSAAMMCKYYGKDTDPPKLNEAMKAKGGFSGNLFVWSVLPVVYPDILMDWNYYIKCETTPAPLNKIDELLNAGVPVIVKVDFNPATSPINEHWVLVVGKQDGSYVINDPIDGTRVKFESRYGAPEKFIFRIAAYRGTPAVVDLTGTERLMRLWDAHEELH